MNEEYISRKALIEGFTSNGCRFVYGNETVKAIVSRIMITPTADVAPVVHGEWKKCSGMNLTRRCNICGSYYTKHSIHEPDYNYCPYCGAKMDGGNK